MLIIEQVTQIINAHPVLATLSFFLLCLYMYNDPTKPDLRHIPTTGYSNDILSYIDAFKYHWDSRGYVQRGYEKFQNQIFKVPTIKGWFVILNGAKNLEELGRVPASVLSMQTFVDEASQIATLIGPRFANKYNHISVIRRQLTRKIPEYFDKMHEETQIAFAKYLPVSHDWIIGRPNEFVLLLICQILNRVCVGAPYCRDDAMIAWITGLTPMVFMIQGVVNAFPKFLHQYAIYIFSRADKKKRDWIGFLAPIIEERRAIRKKSEDECPDALSWLMDEATGDEQSDEGLAIRIIMIIVSGLSTTSLIFTHALYHLASEPQYLEPLREEIGLAVAEAGWTKKGMDKMWKLNSFLKEVMRMHPVSVDTVGRIALQEYTFSDGTVIPKGTTLAAPTTSIHYDANNYSNAHEFQGFRFVNGGDDESKEEGSKPSFVTPTPDFLLFGFGSQACPGRFFAASLLKLVLSYMLLHYDFMLEGASEQGAKRPDDIFIGETRLPDPKVRFLVRKRQS